MSSSAPGGPVIIKKEEIDLVGLKSEMHTLTSPSSGSSGSTQPSLSSSTTNANKDKENDGNGIQSDKQTLLAVLQFLKKHNLKVRYFSKV